MTTPAQPAPTARDREVERLRTFEILEFVDHEWRRCGTVDAFTKRGASETWRLDQGLSRADFALYFHIRLATKRPTPRLT